MPWLVILILRVPLEAISQVTSRNPPLHHDSGSCLVPSLLDKRQLCSALVRQRDCNSQFWHCIECRRTKDHSSSVDWLLHSEELLITSAGRCRSNFLRTSVSRFRHFSKRYLSAFNVPQLVRGRDGSRAVMPLHGIHA